VTPIQATRSTHRAGTGTAAPSTGTGVLTPSTTTGGGAASAGSSAGSGSGAGPAWAAIFRFTLAAVFAGRRLLAGADPVPPAPFVRWTERPG